MCVFFRETTKIVDPNRHLISPGRRAAPAKLKDSCFGWSEEKGNHLIQRAILSPLATRLLAAPAWWSQQSRRVQRAISSFLYIFSARDLPERSGGCRHPQLSIVFIAPAALGINRFRFFAVLCFLNLWIVGLVPPHAPRGYLPSARGLGSGCAGQREQPHTSRTLCKQRVAYYTGSGADSGDLAWYDFGRGHLHGLV